MDVQKGVRASHTWESFTRRAQFKFANLTPSPTSRPPHLSGVSLTCPRERYADELGDHHRQTLRERKKKSAGMLSSYLKQATAGSSNHRSRASRGAVTTSYSSGSDSSDDETSDYSSSILSFGSSAGSPASTSEPSSWKNRATFSSTQDDVVEDAEDNDGTIILSDLSSTMGAESFTILPYPFSDGEVNSPTATKRRGRTGRPRCETFRPDRIDTLASPQYGMDALCSGVPVDCQSLDSQISILDRTCDNMNLDDLTSAQCVNKLVEAEYQRNSRKRERALKALQHASTRWEESRDEKDETADLDEVEIVFNQSTDGDDRSGSLWNGLMLWEVKAPGFSPRQEAKVVGREKEILGSNVVVFSPAPSLRELPRKSPRRIDCSTHDNSTIPSEALVETQVKDARTLISSCGHAISSKLKRRGRSTDAPSLNSFSHSPRREQPCLNHSSSTSGQGKINDDAKIDLTKSRADAVPCLQVEGDSTTALSAGDNKEPETLQSLASSDDDERKPALNIFLTRVPVHPETPSRESSQRFSHHDANITTTESESAKDSRIENSNETAAARTPSRLAQLKMRFNESNRNHGNFAKTIRSDEFKSVEIIHEDSGVELLHPTLSPSKDLDSSLLTKAAPCDSSQVKKGEAVQPTPFATGHKNACLYDSEGNKISLGALKRIELAPKTPRDTRQVPRTSSQRRSVAKESPENKDAHGRPSVRDLVKAFNEKATNEKEECGEKKKVLRIFSAQHKRHFKDTALRTRSDLQSNQSLPAATPLRRNYVSDVGPRRDLIPTSDEMKDPAMPISRSVSLTMVKATGTDSKQHSQPPSLSEDNSILDAVETNGSSPVLSFDKGTKTQPKEEAPSDTAEAKDNVPMTDPTTKPGRPHIDVLAREKPQAETPIEFSPIDFPIVSKQICSTDRLTREFIIQGATRDPPVVLYPLLDFNPCYEVFVFPSDVENHTFEKKHTLRLPRVPKSKVERREATREKRHTPSTMPRSSILSSTGVSDGGIEVALAESHRAPIASPLGKQLLGYVSHSRRTERRQEAVEPLAGPSTEQQVRIQIESPILSDSQIEISDEHQEDSVQNDQFEIEGLVAAPEEVPVGCEEQTKKTSADDTANIERSLASVLSKHRPHPSGTRTVDAVYEPSVEVSGSTQSSALDTKAKKHVTFRNWHVPMSFTNPQPKSQPSPLKSILRASSSHVQRDDARVETTTVPSEGGIRSKEVDDVHEVKPKATTPPVTRGYCTTPKTSNRLAKPTKVLVEKMTRRNKTKKPTPGKVDCQEGREPESSVSTEKTKTNSNERSESEGIEVEPDSQLLKCTATRSGCVAVNKPGPWSKAGREKVVNVLGGLRNQARHLGSGSGPKELLSEDTHRSIRQQRATDTSTMMATVGDASTDCNDVPKSKADSNSRKPRTAIPEKLPLAPSADDDFGFLDDSPPPPTDGYRRSRVHKTGSTNGDRSASLERVSRWIGTMRPSSHNGVGLTKRDRQQILKKNDKATRRFDDSTLFRKPSVPIEKEVYNLLMEGKKTQEDIYQTLTEIAIARKRPNQSLAQAMNELEREVYQVYSEKCREKNEKKVARRRDFDRKLMRAIRKKTEKVVREENEKAKRHRERPDQEPSLFQDAVDFFSSFVICTEDGGLSPHRTPRSVSRRAKSSCLSSPGEDVVYTPNSDKRTFFA